LKISGASIREKKSETNKKKYIIGSTFLVTSALYSRYSAILRILNNSRKQKIHPKGQKKGTLRLTRQVRTLISITVALIY